MWAWRHPSGVGWRPLQARPLNFPLGCGPGDPQARPLNFPLGCGLGDLQGMLGYHPPGDLVRHAGIPPAMHAGIPPPLYTEFLTHATENITLPQTLFAGGNKRTPFQWPGTGTYILSIVTVCKRSCGKVMFSQVFVKNSVHRGMTCLEGGMCMAGCAW